MVSLDASVTPDTDEVTDVTALRDRLDLWACAYSRRECALAGRLREPAETARRMRIEPVI